MSDVKCRLTVCTCRIATFNTSHLILLHPDFLSRTDHITFDAIQLSQIGNGGAVLLRDRRKRVTTLDGDVARLLFATATG